MLATCCRWAGKVVCRGCSPAWPSTKFTPNPGARLDNAVAQQVEQDLGRHGQHIVARKGLPPPDRSRRKFLRV